MNTLQGKLTAVSIVLAMAIFGYNPVFAADSDSGQDETRSSAETLQEETTEALAALKDYTLEQRDEMVEEAKQLIAYLDQRIARLSEKVDEQSASAKEAVKAQWKDTLQALREQRIEISQWLGGLQYGSQDAWEEVKSGFIQAYQDLSEALTTEEAGMEEKPSAST